MKASASIDTSLPTGAWDSHVHVVDEDRFPLHPSHPYRPRKATISDLQEFLRKHGIDHACLVAMSVYSIDNRAIIDGLSYLKGKGRAVACIDPDSISEDELWALHEAGVRAIRLNMHTKGDSLDVKALRSAADRIRPMEWALQLYISLSQVTEVAPLIPKLGVTVIIDHIGAPNASLGPIKQQPGYHEFMDLLRTGNVWTKLSGVYRFNSLPDLDEYVVKILQEAPDNVVWASDWPHSGGVGANPAGDRNKIQDYRRIDDAAWIARCKNWCRIASQDSEEDLVRKIWVENPRKLWQYTSEDTVHMNSRHGSSAKL